MVCPHRLAFPRAPYLFELPRAGPLRYNDRLVSALNRSVSVKGPRRTSRRRVLEVVAEFRRTSILEAAQSVFARHGFSDTTVELIAQAAGVAKGTLYLYFPSKAAIYSAAVVEGLRELAQETARVLASGGDIQHVLRDFFITRLRYFEQHADFFRIYSVEVGNLGRAAAHIRQEYTRLYDVQVESLEHALNAAARSGHIRAVDVRIVASAALDLSHALVVRHVRGANGQPESDVDAVLDLLWKGIQKR